ncbi:MAG: YihY/virulence factor BrkB family protein [Solirubrobacteraceae bacterium]
MSLLERREALDRLQQRHPALAVPTAVLKKFGEDGASNLAALIAYYAFVSLFPLLLVFVTILGYVLEGDARLKGEILKGALGRFPLLSDQLKIQSLSGSGVALGIGIALTLLAGLGVTSAGQTAFNRVWSVPAKGQPNFLMQRLRGIGMLAVLGTLTIVSTVAGGFVGASNGASGGAVALAAGVAISLVANLSLFLCAFKLLSAARLSWRDVLPGAVPAALLWTVLEYFGGLYASHELKNMGPLYGSFALVLALIAWLYLAAHLTLLAAELNVIVNRRLWPRSFFAPGLLDADKRALALGAGTEDRHDAERIDVSFAGPTERREPDRQPTTSD